MDRVLTALLRNPEKSGKSPDSTTLRGGGVCVCGGGLRFRFWDSGFRSWGNFGNPRLGNIGLGGRSDGKGVRNGID